MHEATIIKLQQVRKMNEIIQEQKLKLNEEALKGPDQPDVNLDIDKIKEDFITKANQLKEEENFAKQVIQEIESGIEDEESMINQLRLRIREKGQESKLVDMKLKELKKK